MPLDGLLPTDERARHITLLESLKSYLSVRFVFSTYSSLTERMNDLQNSKLRITITPMTRSKMGNKTGLARGGDFSCIDYKLRKISKETFSSFFEIPGTDIAIKKTL